GDPPVDSGSHMKTAPEGAEDEQTLTHPRTTCQGSRLRPCRGGCSSGLLRGSWLLVALPLAGGACDPAGRIALRVGGEREREAAPALAGFVEPVRVPGRRQRQRINVGRH